MTNFLKLSILLLLSSFSLCNKSLAQNSNNYKIQSLENEKWWSNSIELSSEMPFNSNTNLFEIDNHGSDGQKTTIFFSNKGRVAYTDSATTFFFMNDTLTINQKEESKIKVESVGDNLRDSYLFISRKYVTEESEIINPFYLNLPQYLINVNNETEIEDIIAFADIIIETQLPKGILVLNNEIENDDYIFKNLSEQMLNNSFAKNKFISLNDIQSNYSNYTLEECLDLIGEKVIYTTLADESLAIYDYSWDNINELICKKIIFNIVGNIGESFKLNGANYVSNEKSPTIESNNYDDYLIIRIAQIQSFLPIMKLPLSQLSLMDYDNLETIKKTIQLRSQLLNKIQESYNKSLLTGEPIIRSMEYDFPNQNFEKITDQFMLGDDILVAPIITRDNNRTVKLPKGKWKDDLGKTFNGGKFIEIEVATDRIPYYEKI